MLYTKYCLCCTPNIVYAVHQILFMLYSKYCLCCTQNIFYAVHQILFMLYTKYFLCCTPNIFYAVHQIYFFAVHQIYFLCCTPNIFMLHTKYILFSTGISYLKYLGDIFCTIKFMLKTYIWLVLCILLYIYTYLRKVFWFHA